MNRRSRTIPPAARRKIPRPTTAGGASLITLLTDFGLQDVYVGVMKGVIASIAPRARVIDLTHGVAPQDVVQGGFRWASAVPFFPRGAIHVAVVDPGVGGPREILAARARGSIFIAPDNGLLRFVVRPDDLEEAVLVREPRYFLSRRCSTFHGRDIIAPVAAWVARGLPLHMLGPPAEKISDAAIPEAREVPFRGGIRIAGEIVDIDNFGNCITNIPAGPEARRIRNIRAGGWRFEAPLESYGMRPAGKSLVVVGSMGFLEISVNRGRADRLLRLRRGMRVTALRL